MADQRSSNSLRPHVKNPDFSVLTATPFPDGFDFAATHTYQVIVDGTTISTYVDGTLLDKRVDTTHTAPGIVGFRTSPPETALLRNVKVTSADGSVRMDTAFPAADRTFTAGEVTADGLELGPGASEAWFGMPDEVPALRKDFNGRGQEGDQRQVEQGANAIGAERPDGSFGPVGMNSFNHYAYGAAGAWMYRALAGVSAFEPGYKKILIAPEIGPGVDHVDFKYSTRYGVVRSTWRKDGTGLALDVTVPGNTTAR